jgi:serine/tyrosine/threonine adenylyltransferase
MRRPPELKSRMEAAIAAPGATLETLDLSPGYAALGSRYVELRDPEALPDPYPIAFNPDVAALIGLDAPEGARPEFLKLAAGSARFGAVASYAAVYAGHQFGHFVPQLGDGRAITLAEVATPGGERFEWQIKGGGPTKFSRFADGRAVLRSTIREYLCSEAMAALGIPTTRALAIAGSDEPIFREIPETAAVLTRIAPSLLRFGTFEYFHYRGEFDALKTLADYAIERFYPHLSAIAEDADRYASFLREIAQRTGTLMARWQAVGFAHGVMNTDNMSILGLTLDYGPFGFLDAFDPSFICNHTDAGGRYSFARQPTIGLWNCKALAAALSSLVSESDADRALDAYEPAFRDTYLALLRAKFGFANADPGDAKIFLACFSALETGKVDHTNFFRTLSGLTADSTPSDDRVAALFENRAEWYDWQRGYRERLVSEGRDDGARRETMLAANPKYILRNYLAQTAIEAAEKHDYSELHRLHQILRRPFDEQPEHEAYAALPPDWAHSISVSCSS